MRVALMLLLVAFAGCLTAGTDGTPPVAPPQGHADAEPFGEATIDEGAVNTFPSTNGFIAEQLITISNGAGSATKSNIELSTPAGGVIARGEDSGGYTVTVLKRARAATEAQARDALDTIVYSHDDNGGTTLRLSVHVTLDPPVNPTGVLSRSAEVSGRLPSHLAHDLDAESGSGGVEVRDLVGGNLNADTGSGGIDVVGASFGVATLESGSGGIDVVDSRMSRLEAATGSGGVTLEGVFDTIMADTGSGGIEGTVRAMESGTWELNSGSGGVDLQLDRAAGQKFDIEASAGSGGVDIDLSDGEDVVEPNNKKAHVRSTGYSSAAVQTHILASSGSGGVDIAD